MIPVSGIYPFPECLFKMKQLKIKFLIALYDSDIYFGNIVCNYLIVPVKYNIFACLFTNCKFKIYQSFIW